MAQEKSGVESPVALQRFALFTLLFLLGYLGWLGRPRAAVVVMAPVTFRRLAGGAGSEEDERALAAAVARACGVATDPAVDANPFLAWGNFLPGREQELALAARVTSTSGLLALLAPREESWRIAAWLGPDVLGVPTSLLPLTLPGRRTTALALTDLADQMSGAFTRRETCAIFLADGVWRRVWTRVIESESFWNRTWDRPPGQGWVRLVGEAQWKPVVKGRELFLEVSYRNARAVAAAEPGGRLPEAGRFAAAEQRSGRERYRWDPALGAFVLGYGRIKEAAFLARDRRAAGSPEASEARLPAGLSLAILGDDAGDPGVLVGLPRLLRVRAAGKEGFLPAGVVERLSERPRDLRDTGAWLLPR
ncbi:MAG: hypothetical protein ACM3XS_01150 [Bacteroidota bacterium]